MPARKIERMATKVSPYVVPSGLPGSLPTRLDALSGTSGIVDVSRDYMIPITQLD